ncbi:MAG: transcriptional repressor NrdR [Lachnospiraceae bacterium]|nr:transcriptional repressor NrdR [Lachnospiraceae bacterium]MBQ9910802.1 transcriptional repressor NrdR [Lachnospiraceae bacterium]
MRCPFCNSEDTKVIDSRPAEEQNAIRRRRECVSCSRRFTTYERLETFPMMVIKKDETREPYDREKAEKGIVLACHKRPVSAQQISDMLDDLEAQLFNTGKKEVPVSMIGEIIMDKLRETDAVAYVRFASVYRDFKDVDTFTEEITKLLKKKK